VSRAPKYQTAAEERRDFEVRRGLAMVDGDLRQASLLALQLGAPKLVKDAIEKAACDLETVRELLDQQRRERG
jgi:hypothetical protein